MAIHHPLPPSTADCTKRITPPTPRLGSALLRTSFLSSILAIISRSSLAFSSLQEGQTNLLAAHVCGPTTWANKVVCPLTYIVMRLHALPLVQVWQRCQGP